MRLLNILLLGILCLMPAFGTAMGIETTGPANLGGRSYEDCIGIDAVVLNPARVYHWWVNGNERHFFDASPEDLNQMLAQFAKGGSTYMEVLLSPGKGLTNMWPKQGPDD